MKKKIQKGFSLVELMVVIAIIAILAAVAIPMYSNYTTRANLGTDLAAIGGTKAGIAEQIANSGLSGSDTITGITTPADTPTDVTVAADGAITIDTGAAVSGSSLVVTPTLASGAITWACTYSSQISAGQAPTGCTAAA